MNNPYSASDKAIAVLNRRAVRRFNRAKEQAAQLHFDELNVLNGAKTLYEQLEQDNEEIFLELAEKRYSETLKDYEFLLNSDKASGGINAPDAKKSGVIDKVWLYAILDHADPVTKYNYLHEVARKRDYLGEAVNGSESAKRAEYLKALTRWSAMTAQYADTVSDTATISAFDAMGVEKVRWNTQKDEKVCSICGERDGAEYPIHDIPPKPHWRCRCYWTPAGGNTDVR